MLEFLWVVVVIKNYYSLDSKYEYVSDSTRLQEAERAKHAAPAREMLFPHLQKLLKVNHLTIELLCSGCGPDNNRCECGRV